MNILVTNPTSRLSREIVQALTLAHEVELAAGPFSHGETQNELVKDVDVVVYSLQDSPLIDESERLDQAMRQTYNLLWACVQERVSRFVFLSSLSSMKAYPENYIVNEKWRPLPTTEITGLCFHLAEFVCREYGRERGIDVRVLRLGDLDWDGKSGSGSVVHGADAVNGVIRAVEFDLEPGSWAPASTWNVFHLRSGDPLKPSKFSTRKAEVELGFIPEDIQK